MRSIAATVDADVLKALAGAQERVTGSQLAHLASRSYAQVYAVVGRLVDDGMVRCVRYGRTKTYRLNRDHVLSPIIDRMLAGATSRRAAGPANAIDAAAGCHPPV